MGIEVPMLCIPLAAKYEPIKIFTTRYRNKDKNRWTVLEIAKKVM
jgi:hypothetical protein